MNTLLGGFFVLLLASALFSGVMSRLTRNSVPPAVAASTDNSGNGTVGVGAPPATPEAVLAYEYRVAQAYRRRDA